jgi:dTMP kinase
MAGRLITLEGGEGAGKSTQARMLGDALCLLGLPVLRTREPGGAPGAEFLREVLLSGRIDWSAEAETMMHVAARMEHVAKTIRPAIEAGTWVVCDRFHDSTMAYQGYGQGVDRGMIEALGAMVGIVPDLTLVLDVPRDVAVSRLRRRGVADDRYERLNDAFHQRVNDGFRAIAVQPRCVLLDAGRDAASVHEDVMTAVRGLMS